MQRSADLTLALLFALGILLVNASLGTSAQAALLYDVSKVKGFRESSDEYGRVVQRIYALPDRTAISVTYRWEGGSIRCIGAEAKRETLMLAQASVVKVGGDQQKGFYQEVEEVHYAPDGTGKIIYRARSKFPIRSLTGEKTDEVPLEGTKRYEVFSHWGTVGLGGFR